jgi:acyl-ACP thioesterase
VSDVEPGGVLQSTGLAPGPRAPVFEASRLVRLGDADVHGRLRLDALARHLQDVATDHSVAAGMIAEPIAWVVRRVAIAVEQWPRYLERVTYTTFCSGTGPRWAERRTSVRGSSGGRLEAAVLWAAVDEASGRLTALTDLFYKVWGDGDGRRVSARLSHPAPPAAAEARPWATRASDMDVMGHVNNAAHWEAVEDELARRLPGRMPVTAECEYRLPLDLEDRVRVVGVVEGGSLLVWLVSDAGAHASAVVTTEPGD